MTFETILPELIKWICIIFEVVLIISIFNFIPIYRLFSIYKNDKKMLAIRRNALESAILNFFKRYNLSCKEIFGELYTPGKITKFSDRPKETNHKLNLKGSPFLADYLMENEYDHFIKDLNVSNLLSMRYDIKKMKNKLKMVQVIYDQCEFRNRIFLSLFMGVFTLASFVNFFDNMLPLICNNVHCTKDLVEDILIFPIFITLFMLLVVFLFLAIRYFKLSVMVKNLKNQADLVNMIFDNFLEDINRRMEINEMKKSKKHSS